MWSRKSVCISCLCLVLLIPAFAVGQTDLVQGAVDPGALSVLSGHLPAWAKTQNEVGRVEPDLKIEHLTVLLNRPPQLEKEYRQFLDDQQNPSSKEYHHWLTPAQLGRRFGPSDHDIQAIKSWLASRNLTVLEVSKSRDRISFTGSVSAISSAFAVQMHYFNVHGEKRISVNTEPQVPAALRPAVKGIVGLSTAGAHPQSSVQKVKPNGSGYLCGAALTPCQVIFPADFATIYNTSPVYNSANLNGAGRTIAIIGRANVCSSDIANFDATSLVNINLAASITPPLGTAPPQAVCSGSAPPDQLEATLDVTRAGSIAPGATIDLVNSLDNTNGSGIFIAASYVAEQNIADVMSLSFGNCEANESLTNVQMWDSIFSQAASEGISSFVSSGDSGAAACDTFQQPPPPTQNASPNYICASSYVTCVGGTEFNDFANPAQYWASINGPSYGSALSYIPEGAWNEPLNSQNLYQAAGTGGGVSQFIATPSWQAGPGVPGAQGRYTPDVAFSASGHDAYFLCLAGNNQCSGLGGFAVAEGTSAAAPDMAGIVALLDQHTGSRNGSLNPLLYSLAASQFGNPSISYGIFNDVTVATSGVPNCDVNTPSMCNNSTPGPSSLTGGLAGYAVGDGYDLATGWGSINVGNLLTTGIGFSLSPSTIAVSATGPVVMTATLTPPGIVSAGTVTFFGPTGSIASNVAPDSSGAATFSYDASSLAAGTYSFNAGFYPANGAAATLTLPQPLTVSSTVVQDFQLATPTGITVSAPGQPGSTSLSFTALYGFNSAVSLSCSSSTLPAESSCSFNPSSVTWASGTASATMTVQTTAATARLDRKLGSRSQPFYAFWLPGIVGVFVAASGSRRRKIRNLRLLVFALILIASVVWMSGCGGGSGSSGGPPVQHDPGTPLGTSMVTVTGTSGSLSHSVTVQLDVQ